MKHNPRAGLDAMSALWAEVNRRQDAIIAAVRDAQLVPFCERTGLRFTAGMGSWSFDKTDRYGVRQHYGSDDGPALQRMRIPATLWEFLNEHALGSQNDLGALMQDYTPTTYKG